MLGKSHVITGITTAICVTDTVFFGLHSDVEWFHNASKAVHDFFLDKGDMNIALFLVISVMMYFLGTLLPDVDHPQSGIGRILHMPLAHRTWTHALWIPAIFITTGIITQRYLVFLGIGMLVHDFFDSFSGSGINWLYPIKSRHYISVYTTGEFSEFLIDSLCICFTLAYTFVVLQLVYHFVNITFN